MTKKNDKRLCWNCDGSASQHLAQCPYCGVDLSQPLREQNNPFKGFTSPFQSTVLPDESVPKPPYGDIFNPNTTVSEEEWNKALGEEEDTPEKEENIATSAKRETIAFLLLLPGVVFFLFGLALLFFSSSGVLTLEWNQSFAYFYFSGAVPLLYLGWRALR